MKVFNYFYVMLQYKFQLFGLIGTRPDLDNEVSLQLDSNGKKHKIMNKRQNNYL